MDKTYTVKEVAQMFGVNYRTVLVWANAGKLKGIKFGKSWVFTEANVKARANDLYGGTA